MKKPQCEKPTSYNCGDACINVSKSCQKFPSDSISRQRLQKLKEIAVIYAGSKTKKAQRLGKSANELITGISAIRKQEAGDKRQARAEINQERSKAKARAEETVKAKRKEELLLEAKAKREQLIKMFEELPQDSIPAKSVTKAVQGEKPEKRIKNLLIQERNILKKQLRTDPESSIQSSKLVLKRLQEVERQTQTVLDKARKLIEVENPALINSTIINKDQNMRKAHQKAVEAFSRMIDIPELKDSVNIIETPPERNGRSAYSRKTDKVMMGSDDPAEVIHEASHWLEEKVPGVRAEVEAFYKKRTEGEKLVKMKDVTGNAGYRDDEVTRVDKWLNPYMGKEYKNASEILSMGMEMMYRNPVYLAKNDPEMFDFIYSVVRRR